MLGKLERRSQQFTVQDLDRLMDLQIYGLPSASGVHVTPDTAMRVTAVFCAVRILAETVASLPFNVYRRLPRGKELATSHPLSDLFRRKPNPWQTSFEWRRMMQGHAALRGNGYSELFYDAEGNVQHLIPRRPDKIRPVLLDSNEMAYEHTMPDGQKRVILGADMFHLRGFSSDGIVGDSIVSFFRNTIGLALATEEQGARMFANGFFVPFALKHPKSLSDKAAEHIRDSYTEKHGGTVNAGKPMILEEGMDIVKLGLTAEDAQFLESRKFSISEFARMFRIPPHMLAELDRATFSNIEHLGLEFVTYTMLPWFVNWEQRVDADLLSDSESRRYFTKFNVNALLRGDAVARSEYLTKMFQSGAFSPNMILEFEDMNPVDGGDEHFVQLNMVPLRMAAELAAAQKAQPGNPKG